MHELFKEYPDHFLQRFKKYHKQNPQIFEAFQRLANQMRNSGKARYGARTILEAVRWEHDLKSTGDVFYINNDFLPLYARLLIYKQPEFDGFFELRKPPKNAKWAKSEEQRKREAAKMKEKRC